MDFILKRLALLSVLLALPLCQTAAQRVTTVQCAPIDSVVIVASGLQVSVTCIARTPQPLPPIPPDPVPVLGLFSDGFESGSINIDTTKSGAVHWLSAPYVSVTTALAHSGTHSAVFDQSTGWGELRFDGIPKLPEVWIQFYLYVPPGYATASSQNDKFFRLWGTSNADYDFIAGQSNTVGASSRSGSLFIESVFSPNSTPSSEYNIGQTLTSSTTTANVPFFTPANFGRWMKVGIHAKTASSTNRDGVVEVFLDGAKLTGYSVMQNYPFGSTGRHSFTTGYLLGAMNSGPHVGQKVYVDDVTISAVGFGQ